jgi:hypothetical protein
MLLFEPTGNIAVLDHPSIPIFRRRESILGVIYAGNRC